jgi:SAM-dependent methyltransferase
MTFPYDAAVPSIGLWASFVVGWLACYLGGQRDRNHYRHSLPLVLLNTCLVNVGVVAVCALRQAWNPFAEQHTVWMFLAFFAAVDVFGWAGHWLMHAQPRLWKLHSRYHHRQREPYGIDQFYQHPVDNLLLFTLPGFLVVAILPISLGLFAWVLALTVLGNMLSHGPFGWEHRRHHLGEPVSLGGGVWFDWAVGTSKDTFPQKLRDWGLLVALYVAFVHWRWALLMVGLLGAFKLTLYHVTDVAWLRSHVWRWFYGLLDRVLAWTGQAGFDTLNWGFAPRDDGPVRHPRELHLALYDRVMGDEPTASRILEVGSGRGGGAFHLAGRGYRRLTGIDLSPQHVRRCRRRAAASAGEGGAAGDAASAPGIGPLRFLEGSADSIPVADVSCDVVLNVESSHCYSRFDRFLDECFRVLEPGGRLRWCDFRARGRWDELRAGLATDARWSIREEEDLTSGVLNASRRLTPWYRQRLRAVRWLPPLHATLYNFGCLQGSRNHRKLAEGEWVYGRLVLVKRPEPFVGTID